MLYYIVKYWIRAAMLLFCRKITFTNRDVLKQSGPLLLTLNHPNSFFDALLLGSHFNRPVHFLARGDAFRNPLVKKILISLKLIPIYRLAEGREYLALNDATFDQCRDILLNGGIILIFAEGLCMHQWQLRNLKKGAARIAMDAWAQPLIGDQFTVQPVALNYNSFTRFGKRIIIYFSDPIRKPDISFGLSEAERINQFNRILSDNLRHGMLEKKDENNIVPFLISNHGRSNGLKNLLIERLRSKQKFLHDRQAGIPVLSESYLIAHSEFQFAVCLLFTVILAPFAFVGWLLNAPLYILIHRLAKKKTSGTVFYDSVLFGILLLIYPIYFLVINVIGLSLIQNMYIHCILFVMPLLAWLCLVWKDNLARVIHFMSLSKNEKRVLAFI